MSHSTRKPGQPAATRRTLIKGTGALGLGLAAAPLGAGRAAAQPQQGGTLRIGLSSGNTTDTLDPGTWTNTFVQTFAFARHNYLVEVTADKTLEGEVAESWEASPDARQWMFKIRPGLTFHSGKSVTPADVVASINFHRGDASTSAIKPLVDPITEIRIDGDTVIITLEGGNADFPYIMSDYHLPIMPASGETIDPTSTDGCGPFIVQTNEPGVRADLVRNPNYWKPGKPHFDALELIAILDPAARQAALLTGDIDVVEQIDLKTSGLLARSPAVEILAVTGNQHYTFPMDTRAAPFSDNNVRLALKYAIDREELVEKILFGYGQIGNDHPIGGGNRFLATDLEQTSYDPDKAKFHLKEAGLTTLEVPLSAADAAFNGAVDAAVLFSEKAKAAGITIRPVREPNDGYWSDVWMRKPFCASYWGGRTTEDAMFSTGYAAGAAWNDTFWEHERFNSLLVEARAELDQAKRAEMYREMQQLVRTEGGVIVPMFAAYTMALATNVQHPETVGAEYTLDGFRCSERWWFA